jgi:Protein of unknown function (DUF3761)
MKNIYRAGLLAMSLLGFALALPAHAADTATTTTCKDGTTSSATGRGACSGHGGVQKAASTPAAAPAAQPKSSTASKSAPTAKAGNTDPTGATAKCKDGTYSKSQHHSGTCSSHGGVAEWLDGQK